MNFELIKTECEESILQSDVRLEGVGLHTGEPSRITIRPNKNEDGIFFAKDGVIVPLSVNTVATESRTSSITHEGEVIAMTVEHLLSALYALRIRHAHIFLHGTTEVPIMDGSSIVFVEALEQAVRRVRKQVAMIRPRGIVKITDQIDETRTIRLEPVEGHAIEIQSSVEYPNSPVGKQLYDFHYRSIDDYKREIARARTSYPFYLSDEDAMAKLKLRLKGVLYAGVDRNVNVLDPKHNSQGMRYTEEIARHKVLDFLGDLKVLNIDLSGGTKISLNKSGHRLNHQLARLMLESI